MLLYIHCYPHLKGGARVLGLSLSFYVLFTKLYFCRVLEKTKCGFSFPFLKLNFYFCSCIWTYHFEANHSEAIPFNLIAYFLVKLMFIFANLIWWVLLPIKFRYDPRKDSHLWSSSIDFFNGFYLRECIVDWKNQFQKHVVCVHFDLSSMDLPAQVIFRVHIHIKVFKFLVVIFYPQSYILFKSNFSWIFYIRASLITSSNEL